MFIIKLNMPKSQRITGSSNYPEILFTLKCRNLKYLMGYLIKEYVQRAREGGK